MADPFPTITLAPIYGGLGVVSATPMANGSLQIPFFFFFFEKKKKINFFFEKNLIRWSHHHK
jgi:hypothetical protein